MYMQKLWAKNRGFTVIELLVVIVIIAILAAITTVVYTGVQTRSRLAKIETDIKTVHKLIEAHKARTGSYPITASSLNVDWVSPTARTDGNCSFGVKRIDWVPGLSTTLPQSQPTTAGVNGLAGCYTYTSDGTLYILSAWNMLGDPQTQKFYRRVGLRETDPDHSGQLFFLCNFGNLNGTINGVYDINKDYYKHSYTISNITSSTCDETPQAGA
jgi:prepilin-type N-terminal cleavage/methylation domain-containing protein